MSEDRSPVVLEYGRQPRRFARWIVIVVIAIIAPYIAYRVAWPYLQPWYEDRKYWKYIESLGGFHPGPEVIVFSDDPQKLPALVSDPNYRPVIFGTSSYGQDSTVPPDWPRGYVRKSNVLEGVRFGKQPGDRAQFEDLFSCFRTSPDGTRFLVNLPQIFVFVGPEETRYIGYCQSTFLVPPQPRPLGSLVSWTTFGGRGMSLSKSEHLTLYAPQVDPKDPSGITIKYEVDGKPGTIQCNVQNDGYVGMKTIDGPKQMEKWW